jgi:rSAM/selenodomain-associated transferase 2
MEKMGRFAFAIICILWFAVMAAMVSLGHLSQQLILFSFLYGLAFVLVPALVSSFPRGADSRQAFILIVALGIAGRIMFLAYPAGNDIYRCIWEGFIQSRGFNPYGFAPDDPALTGIAYGDLHFIWQQINYKSVAGAHPPLSMLIFRVAAWLNPTPMFFKIMMTMFDVGLMVILGLILTVRQLPIKRLLFYACNPLVILFIAGEGHVDGLQVFFLFVGILLLLNGKKISGFVSVGMAAMTKYFAAVSVPFFINGRSRAKWLAVLLPLVLVIPYLDAGSKILSTVATFGTTMHYNDSLFALLRYFCGSYAVVVGAFFLLMCFVWIFLLIHDHLRGAYLALGCVIILLPTLQAWYLILIAPFMVFYPSKAWIYLQAAMLLTFPVMAVDGKTGTFAENQWLKLLEYIPFYGLLIWGFVKDGRIVEKRPASPPEDISVIVPVLNEARHLDRCLSLLNDRTALKEIIVADGGSTDGTCEIAERHGARLIQSQKGRGIQIKAATEVAGGDILLILHADCEVRRGMFSKLIETLKANPHVVGGACGMRFDNGSLSMRIAAGLNNARAFLTGISFGDQAQFFRTECLRLINGFPAMMLMEDVELSLRLKEIGKVRYFRNGVLASGRRWRRMKFGKNFLTVIWLFTRYLIERRLFKGEALHRRYYDTYYQTSS